MTLLAGNKTHEICKLTFVQSPQKNNKVKSIQHARSRDQLQSNIQHNHSINLEFKIGTIGRNPCMHAIFCQRESLWQTESGITCNCLSHKPTLQTSRELGHNVKYKQCKQSTYLDITRHHAIRTAYNYHQGLRDIIAKW